ncbi:iron complex transport system ATP-binding protein [Hoeflea marina]|uniref:Iron complex transport system ATP-binding protein n=1 Tax=Hoeflea marina TaxID=274592 RepID=A0A317PQT9_9HYPH|nr:heme ABC transporter ATP-binding protein [Hoeflea marina]PWW03851.1 iron complex transport system ATP-binding protein [Hoeflea marina]
MRVVAKSLSVALGGRTILADVDLVAEAGAVTVVAGPNGSGKTTMLRALCGDIAYAGKAFINGNPVADLPPWRLAELRAVLPQDTALAFPFTVGEVVRIGLRDAAVLSFTQAADRVGEALRKVDLAGFSERMYQELSGGERQRVQLARVLCQIWQPRLPDGPRWLFLDEPVSSLDIRHQLAIMALARDFADRGGGVIAVMHDLNLSAMFADRIVLLRDGGMEAAGEPAATLTDRVLEKVYGCPLRVGAVPADSLFVLPQSVARRV